MERRVEAKIQSVTVLCPAVIGLNIYQRMNSIKNVIACEVFMYVNPIPSYIFMVMTC